MNEESVANCEVFKLEEIHLFEVVGNGNFQS